MSAGVGGRSLSPLVHVCEDPAVEVAALLCAAAEAGGNVALSGGSTPRRAYELARAGDWSRATVWYVDDRAVGPDDERSNHRLVMESLAPPRVERIRGELGAEVAADDYDARLEGVELELVVLGMGTDGHIASLFPGRPEIEIADRRAVAVPDAGMEPYVARVTMTLPMLASARRRVFLVTGGSKRDVLRNRARLPAGRVDADWYVDEAAAGT